MSDPSIDQSVIIFSDLAALPMAHWEKDKLRDRNIVAVIDSAIKKLLSLHFFPVISFFLSPVTACLHCSAISPSLIIFHLSLFDPPCVWLRTKLRRREENQTVMEVKDGAREVNRQPVLHVCDLYVKLIPPWPNSLPSFISTPLCPFLFVAFCCTSFSKLINFWSASGDLNTGTFVQGFGYDPHFLHIYLFVWSFSSSLQVVIPPLTCASALHHYCHGLQRFKKRGGIISNYHVTGFVKPLVFVHVMFWFIF